MEHLFYEEQLKQLGLSSLKQRRKGLSSRFTKTWRW